jgi:hypothetical protein
MPRMQSCWLLVLEEAKEKRRGAWSTAVAEKK